jgi:transposase
MGATWSTVFAAHLASAGVSRFEVAVRFKVSPSTVHYWVHGSKPRESMRLRIQRWSKGAVPALVVVVNESVAA